MQSRSQTGRTSANGAPTLGCSWRFDVAGNDTTLLACDVVRTMPLSRLSGSFATPAVTLLRSSSIGMRNDVARAEASLDVDGHSFGATACTAPVSPRSLERSCVRQGLRPASVGRGQQRRPRSATEPTNRLSEATVARRVPPAVRRRAHGQRCRGRRRASSAAAAEHRYAAAPAGS